MTTTCPRCCVFLSTPAGVLLQREVKTELFFFFFSFFFAVGSWTGRQSSYLVSSQEVITKDLKVATMLASNSLHWFQKSQQLQKSKISYLLNFLWALACQMYQNGRDIGAQELFKVSMGMTKHIGQLSGLQVGCAAAVARGGGGGWGMFVDAASGGKGTGKQSCCSPHR